MHFLSHNVSKFKNWRRTPLDKLTALPIPLRRFKAKDGKGEEKKWERREKNEWRKEWEQWRIWGGVRVMAVPHYWLDAFYNQEKKLHKNAFSLHKFLKKFWGKNLCSLPRPHPLPFSLIPKFWIRHYVREHIPRLKKQRVDAPDQWRRGKERGRSNLVRIFGLSENC